MKFVRVGYVSGSFGLDGAFRVKPVTESPDIFSGMEFLLLAEDTKPVRSLKIRDVRPHGDCLIIEADGVGSLKDAEALKGLKAVVPEDSLPDEEADEIYWYKIEGARVSDTSGRLLGTLADYMETGSCDVFRIKLSGGGYALVSNNKDHVLRIDADKGEITVDPAGLVSEDV